MVSGVSKPIRKSGFLTKKEAPVAAAEVEANLHKGIVPQLRPEPFGEYMEQCVNIDTTLKHYAYIVKELRGQDEKNTIIIFKNMFG